MNNFFSSVAKTTGIHLGTYEEKEERWRRTAHIVLSILKWLTSQPPITAKRLANASSR